MCDWAVVINPSRAAGKNFVCIILSSAWSKWSRTKSIRSGHCSPPFRLTNRLKSTPLAQAGEQILCHNTSTAQQDAHRHVTSCSERSHPCTTPHPCGYRSPVYPPDLITHYAESNPACASCKQWHSLSLTMQNQTLPAPPVSSGVL